MDVLTVGSSRGARTSVHTTPTSAQETTLLRRGAKLRVLLLQATFTERWWSMLCKALTLAALRAKLWQMIEFLLTGFGVLRDGRGTVGIIRIGINT